MNEIYSAGRMKDEGGFQSRDSTGSITIYSEAVSQLFITKYQLFNSSF
ncbi:MAG: hypothetical protein KI793_14570 [Rivularia sp. (in: Bacteria)]|nr:hypothetical protein [Rivularia sp. MS3]